MVYKYTCAQRSVYAGSNSALRSGLPGHYSTNSGTAESTRFPNGTEKSGYNYRPQDLPTTEAQRKLYIDSDLVAMTCAQFGHTTTDLSNGQQV